MKQPLSKARYYSNALPPALFRRLRRAFDGLAGIAWSDAFDTIAHLGRGTWFPFESTPASLIEQTIVTLRPTACPRGRCKGAEWWIRIGEPGDGKPWHFDLDESRASQTGEAHHPVWASVFYLSPTGGETLITPQVAAEGRIDRGLAPEQPAAALAIPPRPNHFVLFPGCLYHCVLPGAPKPGKRRMTLLINWWDETPHSYLEPRTVSPLLPLLAPALAVARNTPVPRELNILRGAKSRPILQRAESIQP